MSKLPSPVYLTALLIPLLISNTKKITINKPDLGEIESFSWIENPQHHHLIKQSFAFALIRLDGADTSMLHMVTDCKESDLSIGTRVQATWSETHEQRITDIKFFKLET